MRGPHSIRFYFSFRSPYAWFAAERIDQELSGFELQLELVPIYPTEQTFPNDPVRNPNKLRYAALDSVRLAAEYGLPVAFGCAIDTDWVRPHAAFLGAQELGAGREFMLEMFRARFSLARDLARDEVIAEAAERCRLPAQRVIDAANSSSLRQVAADGWATAQQRDGLFGVPSFVYEGQLFWGHDRLGSLRRALATNA
jgi:2-hydroxychromene-2-carboxylate isomerase